MVMFLRPTESPVVFFAAIRKRTSYIYKGKEYLNVLDFVGNYEKSRKNSYHFAWRRKKCGEKKITAIMR